MLTASKVAGPAGCLLLEREGAGKGLEARYPADRRSQQILGNSPTLPAVGSLGIAC